MIKEKKFEKKLMLTYNKYAQVYAKDITGTG